MAQKWEYFAKIYTDRNFLQSTLNRLGEDGWELVHIHVHLFEENYECFLKRPILS